jgi:hypothetical protein
MDMASPDPGRMGGAIAISGAGKLVNCAHGYRTTVRQPLHELGRRAVELLMEQNEARREGGAWQGPENIVLPTEFVARATLAAPRRSPLRGASYIKNLGVTLSLNSSCGARTTMRGP